MKNEIPDYYTDQTLTEEEKSELDLEMVANDFPLFGASPRPKP